MNLRVVNETVAVLEELDQRFSRGHRGNVSSVGIFYLSLLKPEDIGKERHACRNRLHGDSDVGDSGALEGFLLH